MSKIGVQITTKAMLVVFVMAPLITSAGPAVICIGQDGYVRVEFALANCCGRYSYVPVEPLPNSYINANCVVNTSSRDNCIDIPILANRYTSIPKTSSPLKILPTTAISISDNVSSHEEFIAKLENPVNYTHASIRTTVLII